jgi:hypothetical protein
MMRLKLLSEFERRCGMHAGELGRSYAIFLRRALPVARAYASIASMIPLVVAALTKAFPQIRLTVAWDPASDLADVARFVVAAACAVAQVATAEEEELALRPKPLPLQLTYKKGEEFGLMMCPLGNTAHVSSLDIDFLAEQFTNACRSMARWNAICGYCRTVAEVEQRVAALLGLRAIVRDTGLTDSEHAHCLFKLALYSKELDGALHGVAIQPSK